MNQIPSSHLMHSPNLHWKGCSEEFHGIIPELCEHTGCEDWMLAREPMLRGDCRIYFLKSASFRLPGLVLKIYKKNTVGVNLAKKLHRKSSKLHKAAANDCTVPEPIMFLPEKNAMAMEFVNAPTAGGLVMKAFQPAAERHAVIHKTGNWLSWFHQHAEMTLDPLKKEVLEEKLVKILDKVGRSVPGALASDRFLSKCVGVAGELAASLEGVVTPHVLSHGDFTPFNLFIDGEKAVGIDYRLRIRRPVSYDISRFLIYLDVCRINHDYVGLGRIMPATAEDLGNFGCRRADFEAFMSAYDPGGTVMDRNLWLSLQFLEITRRMVVMKLPQSSLPNRIFRIMENARLRRSATIIMQRLI